MNWQDDIEPPDEDEETACTCTLIHREDEWWYQFHDDCPVHSFLTLDVDSDPSDALD